MGVTATFCQICGLPVQWNHYVDLDGMFGIWRGKPTDFEPAVKFGPEHEWLKKAVGLCLRVGMEPRLIEGEVQDGSFEDENGESIDDGFVWDGLDDRAALHRACYEMAGSPESWEALDERVSPRPELEEYQQQLFEFEKFVADGHGWMLVDPKLDTPDGNRSRERIKKLLRE